MNLVALEIVKARRSVENCGVLYALLKLERLPARNWLILCHAEGCEKSGLFKICTPGILLVRKVSLTA